jgi:hypothetical protein
MRIQPACRLDIHAHVDVDVDLAVERGGRGAHELGRLAGLRDDAGECL